MSDGGGGIADGRGIAVAGGGAPPAALDGAFLLQLLRKPPRAQPQPQPQPPPPPETRHGVRPGAFFLPHNLIAPPPTPPPPPPPEAEPSTFCLAPSPHAPIPRGLPPGPWDFAPAGADRRDSDSAVRARAEPSASDHRKNPNPAQGSVVSADRMVGGTSYGKKAGSRGRGERTAAYGKPGFRGNARGCARQGNADYGVAESARGRMAPAARSRRPGSDWKYWNNSYGEKGSSANSGEHRNVAPLRSGPAEQWRPQTRTGRGIWVAVNGRHDGKIASEKEDGSQGEAADRSPCSDGDHLPSGGLASNGDVRFRSQFGNQVERNGFASGSNKSSSQGSDSEKSFDDPPSEAVEEGDVTEEMGPAEIGGMDGFNFTDEAHKYQEISFEQVTESLTLADETAHTNEAKLTRISRRKGLKSDALRGQKALSLRMRIRRRQIECRYDIEALTPYFISIYESLIPMEDEKAKQKQLLQSLAKSVKKEWPNAQLRLYGSCANSFGFSKSDIDICLEIDDTNISKHDMLLKLADVLHSENLQNVQALTNARVPIVKMMDPETGISCDICINNFLAVANTKLLSDYAQIDDRLRQLAYIVKHWAKSRGINETYRGTLSSYAYVLMCIQFLQLRKPAILPCLQEMEATYALTIDDIKCIYFDRVDKLGNFGASNNESIAQLLWAFFCYWAYYHDYKNDVISVRMGQIISKQEKDWTRRIGGDCHLICIEDPFETEHDLGRAVDKHTIKILKEEFERAAHILQYDPNPSATLFEPYVPCSTQI